jgi:hypothetical protein
LPEFTGKRSGWQEKNLTLFATLTTVFRIGCVRLIEQVWKFMTYPITVTQSAVIFRKTDLRGISMTEKKSAKFILNGIEFTSQFPCDDMDAARINMTVSHILEKGMMTATFQGLVVASINK